MIFSRKKKEIVNPCTIEQCNSCGANVKRKFLEGDYVFKSTNACNSCKTGQMMILRIFGEVIK